MEVGTVKKREERREMVEEQLWRSGGERTVMRGMVGDVRKRYPIVLYILYILQLDENHIYVVNNRI
jgi:hypothetical protein